MNIKLKRTSYPFLLFMMYCAFVACQSEKNITSDTLINNFKLKILKDPDSKRYAELTNEMERKTFESGDYFNKLSIDRQYIKNNQDRIKNGEAIKVYTEAGMKHAEEYFANILETRELIIKFDKKYQEEIKSFGYKEAKLIFFETVESLSTNKFNADKYDREYYKNMLNKLSN